MRTLAFLVTGLWLVAHVAVVSARADQERPDIVFIIVDDLNDWLGCLGGHPDAKSPNIDALAASGMLFSQAYCNSPQCRPSRTSLNHGVYPFKTGTYFNAKGKGETKITTPTMQEFFSENGYRVASGGKVFHGGPGSDGDSLLKRPGDPRPPKGKDTFGGLKPRTMAIPWRRLTKRWATTRWLNGPASSGGRLARSRSSCRWVSSAPSATTGSEALL